MLINCVAYGSDRRLPLLPVQKGQVAVMQRFTLE
jgi:hypothetical protein